jgi:hypothetical protein
MNHAKADSGIPSPSKSAKVVLVERDEADTATARTKVLIKKMNIARDSPNEL